MNMMTPEISLVILCYRTGQSLVSIVNGVVAQLDRITSDWEIVLVGNYVEGVPDDTPAVVRAIAAGDSRIKTVTRVKKGMMGWDARSGLEAAAGETIALIDGDGQVPPEDIVKVYQKLLSENLDMVKTYRAERHDGLYRRLVSNIYNLIFKILFPGFDVQDVNSKPKIFTRGCFEKLNLLSDDWFLDAEIMIQARRLNIKLGEVPSKFYPLPGRKSFVRGIHILEFFKNLLIARIKEFFFHR